MSLDDQSEEFRLVRLDEFVRDPAAERARRAQGAVDDRSVTSLVHPITGDAFAEELQPVRGVRRKLVKAGGFLRGSGHLGAGERPMATFGGSGYILDPLHMVFAFNARRIERLSVSGRLTASQRDEAIDFCSKQIAALIDRKSPDLLADVGRDTTIEMLRSWSGSLEAMQVVDAADEEPAVSPAMG